MNDTTHEATSGPSLSLYRPLEGRFLTGTALGIAQKLDLPPWLVRVAFVLLSFSGLGIPLYLISWLLIPGEGESEAVGERLLRDISGSRSWVGAVLVVVAVAILASALPFLDGGVIIPTVLLIVGVILYQGNFGHRVAGPPTPRSSAAMQTPTKASRPVTPRPPRPPASPLGQVTVGLAVIGLGALALVDRVSPLVDAQPRHYFALALTVVGLGVLVGTRWGRARWLIPFGLLLIPVSVGAGFVEFVDNRQSVTTVRPLSTAELEGNYDVPVGRLTIDLTEIPWEGQTIEVNGEVGVGSLLVLLPPGVGFEGETEVGIGESTVFDETSGGFGVDLDTGSTGSEGMLVSRLEVGIGEITVRATEER